VKTRIMPTLRPSKPKRLLLLMVFSVTLTIATSIGDNDWQAS
jgi:hypothetical protein